MNPVWATFNENRLSVMGLIPLVVGLALMLGELERASIRPLPVRTATVLVGLLVLASFHHIYTAIGTADKAQTLVLETIVAVALLLVMVRSYSAWPARRPALGTAAADTTRSA
jgi:hypothetical protein